MARLPVPPSEELAAAIAAIQRGEALDVHEEVLFKSLEPPLRRLFSQPNLSQSDTEELAQTTLIRVFEHIDDYRSDGALWAWVRKIAVNTLSNYLRDREALKRRASLEVPLEPAQPDDEDHHSRPDEELSVDAEAEMRVVARQERRLLRDALAELPEGMRQAMVLRLSDLKYREIGEILGVDQHTIGSQLHAAKDRLRRILAEHFPELEGGEER